MAQKHKWSDADNSDMQRSCKVLSLSESYVCIGKKKNLCRVHESLGFQGHTGGLGTYTPQIRGDFIYVFTNMYFY